MIERHITFNVHPGRGEDFERFFVDQYRPAMSASPGFVRVELLREIDAPMRFQMMLRFDDAESAARWRTSEVHVALQPALTALFSDNEIVGYTFVA